MGDGGFMESALVVWVQSLHAEPLSFRDLARGSALLRLLGDIDPRAVAEGEEASSPRSDGAAEGSPRELLETWGLLMRNIKAYYRDVLQQYVVMRLPDLTKIAQDPHSQEARDEMQKVLLLMLGLAVQGDSREDFVSGIKQHLPLSTQQALMEHIRAAIDDSATVYALDTPPLAAMPPPDAAAAAAATQGHLTRLVNERDAFEARIHGLVVAVEELKAEVEHTRKNARSMAESMVSESPDKSRGSGGSGDSTRVPISEELADVKALVRKLRQELDEKMEICQELQEDVKEQKGLVDKLQAENLELVQDARTARMYRDELDILQEKASRVDKHEAEITKYKEKLNELDFYKSRVEELRDDNTVLLETRESLQASLDSCHQRIGTVVALEEELLNLKQQVIRYSEQRDEDRQKIQELVEENARLEFVSKSSLNESASLEEELNKARHQGLGTISNSLNDQLNETANTRILRLELENQNLKKKLQEAGEIQMLDSATKVLALEKENRRLANKVEKLQAERQSHSKDALQLEESTNELSRENKQLQECIETIKESSERQVKELECEKEQLEQMLETLRERNEKTHDLHIKETERENKKLHQSVKSLTSQVSELTYEHRQLQKSYEQVKSTAESLEHMQEENHMLEQKNVDLEKEVSVLKLSCDQFEQIEQQCLDMEVEKDKLVKTVERLQKSNARLDTVEEENTTLKVEAQQLRRMVENMKSSTSKVADLEQDKDRLNRELQQLKKALDGSAVDRSKQEQLEVDLLEMDTENQKLERKVEVLSRRVAELEQDNTDLDAHTDSLQKNLETMRISLRKLDDIEQENKAMETELSALSKEKSAVEKENKKLKQSLQLYEVQFEDMSSKLTAADRENKSLKRQAAQNKDTNSRIHELEQEKADLMQQASVDRKTLHSLREDLVKEKIQVQDISNEVERLRNELERKTITSEKQQAPSDYTKTLETLEHRLEGGLKQSVALKDEKIASLESRLEAARKHNLRVQEELKDVRRDYEMVVQQNEDIVQASLTGKPQRQRHTEIPHGTQEILRLKDDMITLQRTNATLEEEVKHLKATSDGHKLQAASVQVENSKFQSQLSSVQTQYNMLQSQYSKTQVENQSLQAQCSSLTAEIKRVEGQRHELEQEHGEVMKQYAQQHTQQEVLVADHDQLSRIHEQMASEYEALISEHGSLKANYKALKAEHRQLEDKLVYVGREKETVSQLKEMLDRDKESFRSDSQLRIEYVHLKDELLQTQHVREKLRTEIHNLEEDYRGLKGENEQLKGETGALNAQLSDSHQRILQLELEVSSLINKLESCSALNEKLEDDNRNLMMQLQALLNQNQELLTGCLDSKDQLAEEQKAYIERLAELRRQKEKLEEKIMEQYKRYDPVKKKSGFGNLMRKLMRGTSRSKSQSKLDDSPENTSIGSGENPKLNQRNKTMAKSTTALNITPEMNGSKSTLSLRAARSTDNLAMDVVDGPLGMTGHGSTEWQQTPIRSRQMLESLSGSSLGQGSRAGSLAQPDDDSDDEMTLEQFLKECDKSPKSRRKMIKEMKDQEKAEIKKNRRSNTPKPEPETMVLSPDLGPRPPTVEPSEPKPYKSKSEMNLSKVSSGSEYSDQRYSPMTSSRYDVNATSTPKQNPQQFSQYAQPSRVGGGAGMEGPNHNHTRNPSPHPRSTPGPKPDSYGGSHTMPRQNSANSTSSSGSIGGYNAMTRTTNNMVRSHTVGGGIGGGSNGAGVGMNSLNNSNHQSPRSGGQGERYESPQYATPSPSSRHTPVQRPTTPGAHYAHHQQQQQHQQQHQQQQQQHQQQQQQQQQQQHQQQHHYLNDPPPYQPPPPPNKPLQQQQQHYQQQQQQQQHHPQQQQQRDDYSPGNVRSLVHNYQISMNNSVSNNTITTSNGPNGSGPSPTAPPRRSRPMSAGPLRSSSNSAFSVPPRQTDPDAARGTGRALPKPPPALTTPRTLPRTPDAGDKAPPGKLSAPPPLRPQSQGPNGEGTPRKNATWYEYGCV